MTARAWIELPDPAWGPVQLARSDAKRLGYAVEVVRGTGRMWLRLAGSKLGSEELWAMPPG